MHLLLLLVFNKKLKFFDKNMSELKKNLTKQINQTEPPTPTEALQ